MPNKALTRPPQPSGEARLSDKAYVNWKRRYGRGYNDAEDRVRYQLFLEADARIARNQNRSKHATFGHNAFSAATEEERRARAPINASSIIGQFPPKDSQDTPGGAASDKSAPDDSSSKTLSRSVRRELAVAPAVDWTGALSLSA